ncbi:MAG: hypothetical protein GXP53_03615 [Deltaproteobacteria bacterium]|nr:hypothetical protein [Deltaproteobacteria bacterium]
MDPKKAQKAPPENRAGNLNGEQDDLQIKAEIDAIGKRIDNIVEIVEEIYPLSTPEKTEKIEPDFNSHLTQTPRQEE